MIENIKDFLDGNANLIENFFYLFPLFAVSIAFIIEHFQSKRRKRKAAKNIKNDKIEIVNNLLSRFDLFKQIADALNGDKLIGFTSCLPFIDEKSENKLTSIFLADQNRESDAYDKNDSVTSTAGRNPRSFLVHSERALHYVRFSFLGTLIDKQDFDLEEIEKPQFENAFAYRILRFIYQNQQYKLPVYRNIREFPAFHLDTDESDFLNLTYANKIYNTAFWEQINLWISEEQ